MRSIQLHQLSHIDIARVLTNAQFGIPRKKRLIRTKNLVDNGHAQLHHLLSYLFKNIIGPNKIGHLGILNI